MVKIFGGGMEISCEIDDDKKQLLCKASRKGKVEAAVLGKLAPDGDISIVKERGPMNTIKVLKEYMKDSTTVKIEKPINEGEF